MTRQQTVHALFVGGPMYDPLYDLIPAFEREHGVRVEIVARLPHPELNAYVKHAFARGDPGIDVLSTHTKYAPSQAQWLAPLDRAVDRGHLDDLLARPAELSRIDGTLRQVPRNLDVRLLHYRTDLFESGREREAFERAHGRPLAVPRTWNELVEVATFFTRGDLYGFVFPGRDSGLFGTWYELLVGAGGALFDESLGPAFDSAAGVWAAEVLAELHHRRRVTPPDLPTWHYDEVSAAFRAGRAAMVCDWPGSYHLYTNPATCAVSARVGLALLPEGPMGIRAAYAGCHSFAIAASSPNPGGAAALVGHLTSFDAQLGEARHGAIPCRASALQRIRDEAASTASDARRWALLSESERIMIVPPRFAAYPQCEDAIWRSLQGAMQGLSSASEAVSRAADDIHGIMSAAGAGVRPAKG